MRYLPLPLSVLLFLCVLALPSHAANKPRGGKSETAKTVWTNDEIEKLRARGLITVFTVPEVVPATPAAPAPYDRTKDPMWYAKQAAELQTDLASARAELGQYRKTLDDAKSLKRMTGGVALDQDTLGFTPEAGIEILERRVHDVASQIDALEELARRNGFPPGVTRG
jgi:hypothetical protein